MDLEKLFLITENLRKKIIGDPVWIEQKHVFEYEKQSIEVVAVLKIIRAAHSLKSMLLLCEQGLFVDMSAIFRVVHECCSEVQFLLENHPAKSEHVEQFVKAFFETTIDMQLDDLTPSVQSKKIHSASARILSEFQNEHATSKQLKSVYKAYSGYVHSNYAHIMQIYGGPKGEFQFHLNGITNLQQKKMQLEIVQGAYDSVVNAFSFAALKFGVKDLYIESRKLAGEM